MRGVWIASVLAGLLLVSFVATQEPRQLDAAFFREKVAPILQRSCVQCHNPDRLRGGLDLSSHAGLMEGSDQGPAVVPGQARKSRLVALVQGPKAKMPRQGDALSQPEVDLLAQWIDGGAPWPKDFTLKSPGKQVAEETWWSLQPIVKPELPKVKDEKWANTAIDRFVLAKLEEMGLKPSVAADRVTFIRRVTFDLHGLPPTPQEIDAFVADRDADAFEKLIDRLLASPRYGERWGRYWLDIVHYADTHGFDKDKRRLWAWLYRDWVVRAFNRDLPFRRFLRHQLAGDVLFPNDPDGAIATGFVVAGPWDFVGQVELREGTVDKEKTRVLDRDDMVANAISTFCSMTAHCARCHDHKFDPISTREYYQLQAVFAGVERGDRAIASPESGKLKTDLLAKEKALQQRVEAHRAKAGDHPALAQLDRDIADATRKLQALPPLAKGPRSPSNGFHSEIYAKPESACWVQVDLGQPTSLDEIALVPARPVDFADTPGFGFPVRFKVEGASDADFAKPFVIADQTKDDFANPGDAPQFFATNRQARYVRVTATKLWKRTGDYVFALAELQAFAGGKNIALGSNVSASDSIEAGLWGKKHLVDDFDSRYKLPSLADPAIRDRMRGEAVVQTAPAQREALLRDLVRKAEPNLLRELDETNQQLLAMKDGGMKAYAVLPIAPRPIHVLHRGEVESKRKLVQPGALSLLPMKARHFGQVKPNDEGSRRAALAEWLADDDNVLTWRSIVNRVWQQHFGRGLVDTPNDFGRNGSRPTHPELLDWLAHEFRDADSFKKLHRVILLSSTYRQASTHSEAHAKIDGDNRYWWRMNRARLDAEAVRDSVLAVSGKLDLTMHGPGFDLFRFKDDHSPIYDHLDLTRINAPDTWRRTVYRFVVRSVPNPFLESLDCADPNISVPMRNTTMTSLQALALLNNPFMVKQAEFFAERVRKQEADPVRQVEAAFRLALGRAPGATERDALAAHARRHGLANACRLLLNASEFLFVD